MNGLACCFSDGSFNYFLLGFPPQSGKCINNSDATPLPADDASIFSLLFVFPTLPFELLAAPRKQVAIFLDTYWHTDFLSLGDFPFCYFRMQEHRQETLSGMKLCRIVSTLPSTLHNPQVLLGLSESEMLEIHARAQPHTPQLPSYGMPHY